MSECSEERVLILAPRGRNAPLLDGALRQAGFITLVCEDAEQLCREMQRPTGSIVLCEEGLGRLTLKTLSELLSHQPPWSELPMLVLTGGGRTTSGSLEVTRALGPRGNVTLLERPVRIITLVSAVRAAIRTRRRQYEVRDLLAREQASRAQAEAASSAKDQFLAALSHELRTPLNPVLMTAAAMAEDPSLSPEARADAALIKRNIELEAKLIDDLLDLTRIARGKLELHREVVDLHTLIDHAVLAGCEGETPRKQLTLTTHLDAQRRFVWGDAARLAQVFWNLIKNAVKFTPEGGSVSVRTADGENGSIVATVADNGIGIEPHARARIFDAFEQESRGITRQFGGLGLGLAITKALVELHGGAIEVQSEGRDRGATFTLRLPAMAEPQAAAAPQASPAGNGRATPLRILLVEDHDTTATVMARLLRGLGHTVAIAPTVEEARRLSDAEQFEVVISDLGLPDGSGLDVIRHLAPRRIPFIAVSGYGMEEDVRQSREAGFKEHLVKPIDLSRLQTAIQRAVEQA